MVDVWRIPLDLSERIRAPLTAALDEREREQAGRMRAGGERWAVARGVRRLILGRCVGVAPGALRFEAGLQGKPGLAGVTGLHFNMSAREGLALLAVSSAPVGVDLERELPWSEVREVARQFLPESERAALEAAPEDQRARRFVVAWTRYEAVRKLFGLGLDDVPPDAPHARAAEVMEIVMPAGFAAAVATEGGGWSVRLREANELLALG